MAVDEFWIFWSFYTYIDICRSFTQTKMKKPESVVFICSEVCKQLMWSIDGLHYLLFVQIHWSDYHIPWSILANKGKCRMYAKVQSTTLNFTLPQFSWLKWCCLKFKNSHCVLLSYFFLIFQNSFWLSYFRTQDTLFMWQSSK